METGPRFKVSSERPEERGIGLAIPGLVERKEVAPPGTIFFL